MINKNILVSIFEKHQIDKVILKETEKSYDFIISEMNSSFNVAKWDYLEHVLEDILGKKINIIALPQATKYFGNQYIESGMIIR